MNATLTRSDRASRFVRDALLRLTRWTMLSLPRGTPRRSTRSRIARSTPMGTSATATSATPIAEIRIWPRLDPRSWDPAVKPSSRAIDARCDDRLLPDAMCAAASCRGRAVCSVETRF